MNISSICVIISNTFKAYARCALLVDKIIIINHNLLGVDNIVNDVRQDIELADRIVSGEIDNSHGFNHHSFIYRVTNEPLDCCRHYLRDRNRIVAVTASGDQILKSIALGTNEVDTFDISSFPKYYLDLKISAVKSLSREEYFNLFYNINIDDKDAEKLYTRVSDKLEGHSKLFWDHLKNKLSWNKLYRTPLFTPINAFRYFLDKEEMMKYYSLLSEQEYNDLQERIGKVRIRSITADFNNIASIVSGTYDLAYLSNVIDYVPIPQFESVIKNIRFNPGGLLFNVCAYTLQVNKLADYRDMESRGYRIEKANKLPLILTKRF